MKSDRKKERWDGGHIHRQKDGRPLFIIERQVSKRRFHISTRCHTASAAYEHLRRFEADPFGYEREMKEGGSDEVLRLTVGLLTEFRDHLLTRDKPTSRAYANEMFHRLTEWIEDLGGADLRRLELKTLKTIVNRRDVNRQHRIIAIKIFCAWLREEKHILDRRDDVTLDFKVPQARPEKWKRRKVAKFADVQKVLGVLAPAYRDCLMVLANTGWHLAELERFIRNPEAQIVEGRGDVLAVLQVRHKSGDTTRTPVTRPEVVEAARRLKARGQSPRRINDHVVAACKKAKVPVFHPGEMRHSLATWAVEAGTPPEVVAEFLGHKSKSTTLRYYVDIAVPTATVVLPKT